jgi:tetratricopeptide (TPR) repeat protein
MLFAVSLAAVLAAAEPPPLERARELYNRTEYEAALALLGPIAQKDSATYLLMGQCQYMQGEPRKSSELFLKAVQLDPANSDSRMWLARAYGRRAETSSFFTAPGFATKARENFEQAIQLNPMNLEAMSDLFEYYLDAPGFLGGGLDRAAALAKRMGEINPAEYHWGEARLAEKRKEYQTAEQHFRRARSDGSSTWPASWPRPAAIRKARKLSSGRRRSTPIPPSCSSSGPAPTSTRAGIWKSRGSF